MKPCLALLVLVAAGVASAQSTAAPPRFEVVSIKPAPVPADVWASMRAFAGACGLPALQLTGERVLVQSATLCGLIRLAYDVADYQVVDVPADLARGDVLDLFEVQANALAGTTPTRADAQAMMRAMLADRFALRVRREPREMPVYALVPVTDGPRLNACTNPQAPSGYQRGRLISCNPPMPMARIAQMLTIEAGRPVIDRTGLTTPAFELLWLPEGAPAQPDSPPFLFTAIQEQLGLRLEPQRGAVDAVVVEHAARPTPN